MPLLWLHTLYNSRWNMPVDLCTLELTSTIVLHRDLISIQIYFLGFLFKGLQEDTVAFTAMIPLNEECALEIA